MIMVILICAQQPSYAGFTVKKSLAVAAMAAKTKTNDYKTVNTNKYPNDYRSGTLGTLSFIFGFCGFIPVIGALFSIAAIILGSMGLRRKQKHSLAGLILGIGTITLGIIITILIFASI